MQEYLTNFKSISIEQTFVKVYLSIQDNLLKASAKELLRTDLLHLTTKEQNKHTEYAIGSYVLVHYRTCLPPTRLHTSWKGPMKVIKGLNSRYTLLDLVTGKEMDFHVSDMKPFVFDSAVVVITTLHVVITWNTLSTRSCNTVVTQRSHPLWNLMSAG